LVNFKDQSLKKLVVILYGKAVQGVVVGHMPWVIGVFPAVITVRHGVQANA